MKLFQVVCFNDISMAFRRPVLVPDTPRGNGIILVLVPVPVPVPDTASVITPIGSGHIVRLRKRNSFVFAMTLVRVNVSLDFPRTHVLATSSISVTDG